jgi:hypothetical protein
MASSAKSFAHFTSAVLASESQDEFASLCSELKRDVEPQDVIERTYVHEIACYIWEAQRLRRFKTVIINNSRRAAMQGILEQLLDPDDFEFSNQIEQAAAELARGWFENDDDKASVAKLLGKFQLDETAIEAEAFRLNAEDLERLDRMQAVFAVRFEKALRCIAEYRKSFSTELKHAADQILNNDDVPRLVSQSSKASHDKRAEG